MRVLIAGCGYVGRRLGERLVSEGHEVTGIRRPGSEMGELRALGIKPLGVDLSDRVSVEALPAIWDWVVACMAPSGGGVEGYRSVYVQSARNLMERLRDQPPKRLVFTSSTGVYPQNDGSEVDEHSPTEEVQGTGAVLREAEKVYLGAEGVGVSSVVLRVAGIYGPGRNRIAAIRRGEVRGSGNEDRWMNMIHRDDLVSVLVAALERGQSGEIYNVSDGAPCREREFFGWLSQRLGVRLPEAEEGGVGGPGGRVAANKRVISRRVRAELGWAPRWVDYRAGYEQELAAGA